MGDIRVDEGQLSSVVKNLRSGSSSLNNVAEKLPEAVNAGFSSDVANAALARIGQIALALAQQGETMASNVNAAEGQYQTAEDENRNKVETEDKVEERKRAEAPPPLEDAPSDDEEYKNRPKPSVETAPAPTPPPSPSPDS